MEDKKTNGFNDFDSFMSEDSFFGNSGSGGSGGYNSGNSYGQNNMGGYNSGNSYGQNNMGGYNSGNSYGQNNMGGYNSGNSYGQNNMGGYNSGNSYGQNNMGGYNSGNSYGQNMGGYNSGNSSGQNSMGGYNNPGGMGYYTGYYDNYDQNNGGNSYTSVQSPMSYSDNYSITGGDPDRHIATAKDGIKMFFMMFFMGIFFIGMGLLFFVLSDFQAKQTREFFENSESVQGTVVSYRYVKGSSGTRKKRSSSGTKSKYYLTIRYSYAGSSYLTESESLTVSKFSSMGFTESNVVGKNITVYVDTRKPSSIRIIYESNPQPFYIALVFPLVGVFLIIAGFGNYKKCKEGKMMVTKRRGKIVFTPIK